MTPSAFGALPLAVQEFFIAGMNKRLEESAEQRDQLQGQLSQMQSEIR